MKGSLLYDLLLFYLDNLINLINVNNLLIYECRDDKCIVCQAFGRDLEVFYLTIILILSLLFTIHLKSFFLRVRLVLVCKQRLLKVELLN